ncbi:MAG: leucine-rich repeat protein, partial [Ruminococcus sp.]|nr:leucine-rich repeat protein [Ruminococcus sp.]
SVVIPDSVTVIGWGSFSDCTALTSVNLPANLKKLDAYAFRGCKNLPGSLVLPESLTSMASGVFWGCSSLTSVSLPKNIKTIGEYTFYYCTSLESVSFADDLTGIQARAFEGCAKFDNIKLSDTLRSIGDYAFLGCESLTEFIMPDTVENIGCNLLENCINIETVKLSENIKEIKYGTFRSCESLKEVTIPEKVKSFGVVVFLGCSSLKKITVLNPECKLSDGCLSGNKETVIYGYTDSTAQTYAEKYKHEFVALDEEPTTNTTAGLLGDANGDGKLSLADAVLIMQAISNPDEYSLNEEQKNAADVVDAGGGLTPMDALAIQMIDLQILSKDDLPVTSEELNSALDKN